MSSVSLLWALGLVLAGGMAFVVGGRLFAERRLAGMAVALVAGAAVLSAGAVAGVLWLATRAYRPLRNETVAVVFETRRTGPGRFTADFMFPGGRDVGVNLAGDSVEVVTHVLTPTRAGRVAGLRGGYEVVAAAGRPAGAADAVRLRTAGGVEPAGVRRAFPIVGLLYDVRVVRAVDRVPAGRGRLEVRLQPDGRARIAMIFRSE